MKLLQLLLVAPLASALDNGLRVPPMGWSSWYGFTSNIDEVMLRDMADGMVSTGLNKVGFEHIWIDDGWVLGREPGTNKPVVDPVLFPSGMANLTAYVHSLGLKFGIYTSKGEKTCLGYQPSQPNRTGACGFEQIDADTYAHDWQVDQVKDDGCGNCPQHEPFAAMRDALNKTGRPIWYTIHGFTDAGTQNVANLWRVGGDLSQSSFDMWTDRLDLATTKVQADMTGPGAFPDPDFLEVGYSPRNKKGSTQSVLEQRSMFTMWAALPTSLILSADLRPGNETFGIDADILAILTNTEVIAINQDPAAQPMRIVTNTSDGLQVWKKPLAATNTNAIVLFHRGANTTEPLPSPPVVKQLTVAWKDLGYSDDQKVAVRDLWAKSDLGTFTGSFSAQVTQRDARLYTFTAQ